MHSGPLDAEVVIVGRDPGVQEVRVGRPFVGPSGRLLNKAMERAGLVREAALVTNVCSVRPPGDRWEAHHRGDVDAGVRELHDLLGTHPRRLVVALGNEAFRSVVRGTPYSRELPGIEDARGYLWDSPYGPTLAMTHPAAILRQWVPWWACFRWDWQRAARLLAGVKWPLRSQWVVETVEQAESFVKQALAAPMLAVDTETDGDGMATRPACVAFAANADEGVCFPLTDWTRPYVEELLASPVPKVLQNGQFDTTVLARVGLPVVAFELDIMLLWHSIEPLLAGKRKEGQRTEKSLRFLVSLLVDGQPFYKDYNFATPMERWLLCAIDARCTLEIAEKLLAKEGIWQPSYSSTR